MSDINDIIIQKFITEKTFRNKMYKRTAQTARAQAAAGKIRQLARGTALSKQISLHRAKLTKLLDRQRQMYAGRARAAAMRG